MRFKLDFSIFEDFEKYFFAYISLTLMPFSSLSPQVVGIFAGFGLLLLVASPFLLLATPFVLCCKCKCSKGDDDPLPT